MARTASDGRKVRTVIRKNDLVQILTGTDGGRKTRPPEGWKGRRDLGTRGRVKKVDYKTGRAIVDGANTVKKAVRPDARRGHRGGLIDQNAPIDLSNLMIVCRRCDRPVRLRIVREKRKLTRLCRRCGAEV